MPARIALLRKSFCARFINRTLRDDDHVRIVRNVGYVLIPQINRQAYSIFSIRRSVEQIMKKTALLSLPTVMIIIGSPS
jgi:hypothetical protein